MTNSITGLTPSLTPNEIVQLGKMQILLAETPLTALEDHAIAALEDAIDLINRLRVNLDSNYELAVLGADSEEFTEQLKRGEYQQIKLLSCVVVVLGFDDNKIEAGTIEELVEKVIQFETVESSPALVFNHKNSLEAGKTFKLMTNGIIKDIKI